MNKQEIVQLLLSQNKRIIDTLKELTSDSKQEIKSILSRVESNKLSNKFKTWQVNHADNFITSKTECQLSDDFD